MFIVLRDAVCVAVYERYKKLRRPDDYEAKVRRKVLNADLFIVELLLIVPRRLFCVCTCGYIHCVLIFEMRLTVDKQAFLKVLCLLKLNAIYI